MEAEDPQSLLEPLLADWRPDLTGTLLFLTRNDDVLLIRKKRGHGAGKINGPGGKLDAGESPAQCAVRETLEETGVEALNPQLAAVMRFLDLEDEDWLGYVFVAHRHRGKLRETLEAVPVWCARDEIPFDEMWDDDRYWLPRILAGEVLRGDFLFRAGTLIAHRLHPLGREEAVRANEHSSSINPELLSWD